MMESLDGFKSYLTAIAAVGADGFDVVNIPDMAWVALAALFLGKGLKDAATAWSNSNKGKK